jgi:hypothetical protein
LAAALSILKEADRALVGSEQLIARFAVHVAITATQVVVSPNRFVARGNFLDYSASVFSNVCSKLPHGLLEAVPVFIASIPARISPV